MALQRRWAAEDLGERLERRRVELGLTQEQVAERMPGVTLRAYQRWARGHVTPQMRNLEKVAAALEMDPNEFINRPPDLNERQSQLDRLEAKLDRVLSELARLQVEQVAAQTQRRAKAKTRRPRPRKRGAGGSA